MPFGDQYTTSGGKALQFHASVRLRLKGVGKIKEKVNGVDTVVGQEVECVVVGEAERGTSPGTTA